MQFFVSALARYSVVASNLIIIGSLGLGHRGALEPCALVIVRHSTDPDELLGHRFD